MTANEAAREARRRSESRDTPDPETIRRCHDTLWRWTLAMRSLDAQGDPGPYDIAVLEAEGRRIEEAGEEVRWSDA